MSVRNQLIKLAYENPRLRGDLLPVINKIGHTLGGQIELSGKPSQELMGQIEKGIDQAAGPQAVKDVAHILAGEFEKNPAFREKIVDLANHLEEKGMVHQAGLRNPLKSLQERTRREQERRERAQRAGLGADLNFPLTIALMAAANALLAEHGGVPAGMSEFLRDMSLSTSVLGLIGAAGADYRKIKK